MSSTTCVLCCFLSSHAWLLGGVVTYDLLTQKEEKLVHKGAGLVVFVESQNELLLNYNPTQSSPEKQW